MEFIELCRSVFLLLGLTNVVLGVVHVITGEDYGVKPQVSSFLKLIEAVQYVDGCHHSYYNEMKVVMTKFFIYWRETMDEAVKRADNLCHQPVDKEHILLDVVNTIRLWREHEKKFNKEFLPIESIQQQKIYDDLHLKFRNHMAALKEIKTYVEKIDQKHRVVAFANDQYAKAVESKSKVFVYAHNYLSMLLVDHLPEIGGSLKENLRRSRKNLQQLEETRETGVTNLLHQLYEKQKEQLACQKRGSRSGIIEANVTIDKLRTEVLNSGNHDAIWQLKNDVEIFERRCAEFERIATNLNMLRKELEQIYREERVYNARLTAELPGSKYDCWQEMGKNFTARKLELKQKLVNTAKTLMTFFVVRSTIDNVMTYENNLERFSIDFFGHQINHLSYGLKREHLDCTGQYRKINDKNADYYDINGRYLLKNNKKVYQVSDCTSLYNIGEDTLLKKMTVDCGHSEATKQDCALNIKEEIVTEILPTTEPVDIKKTLKAEVVKYLWDAFGGILPDALNEVCQLRPKNPIHRLAHCLLKHKYSRTPAELSEKNRDAEAYRANIFKERKDKAVAESLAWKAKQVKRRKPEESDDSFNRAVYDIYVATNEFISSLDYYN